MPECLNNSKDLVHKALNNRDLARKALNSKQLDPPVPNNQELGPQGLNNRWLVLKQAHNKQAYALNKALDQVNHKR